MPDADDSEMPDADDSEMPDIDDSEMSDADDPEMFHVDDSEMFYGHTYESYARLGNISTTEETLAYIDIMREDLPHGMFFVMREHVFPCWDDLLNIGGTTVSLKILKECVVQDWEDIVCSVLGKTFMKDESLSSAVNGISISPKRSFCIIKIWMRQPGLLTTIADATIPPTYTGHLHCSANADNIKNNNNARGETHPDVSE
eukprot:gene17294-23606_t